MYAERRKLKAEGREVWTDVWQGCPVLREKTTQNGVIDLEWVGDSSYCNGVFCAKKRERSGVGPDVAEGRQNIGVVPQQWRAKPSPSC